MAESLRAANTNRSMLSGNLALGVLGLFAVFAAALIAGVFSHTAGAIVAVVGAAGLAAWWWPRIDLSRLRDAELIGLIVIGMSPLIPARLSSGVAGLSPDDLPLVLGTMLLLTGSLRRRGWRAIFHWAALPMWAYAVWNAVAVSVSGGADLASLARGPGRWALVALAFSLMINVMLDRPGLIQWALGAVVLVGVAEALFGLWSYLVDWTIRSDLRAVLIGLELWRWYQPLVETTPGRISGTLGVSSNFFGGLMLIPTLASLVWAARAQQRLDQAAATLAFAATFIALVLSYTRASLIAVVGAGVLLLVVMRSWRATALGVAVLAIALISTPMLSRFFDEGNDRLALTERALEEIAQNPELGLGAGSQTGGTIDPDLEVLVATPHNSFLLAGAETGAVGGLLLLVGAVLPGAVAAWAIVRGRRDPTLLAFTAGLLAFGVQTFSNNLLHIPTVSAWYWIVAAGAVAIALGRSVPDHRDAEPVLG